AERVEPFATFHLPLLEPPIGTTGGQPCAVRRERRRNNHIGGSREEPKFPIAVEIPAPNLESLLTWNGQRAVVGPKGDERSGISLDGNLGREYADFLQLWKLEHPDGVTGQGHQTP